VQTLAAMMGEQESFDQKVCAYADDVKAPRRKFQAAPPLIWLALGQAEHHHHIFIISDHSMHPPIVWLIHSSKSRLQLQ